MKLRRKTRHGAHVHEVFDTSRMPCQPLIELNALPDEQKDALRGQCRSLNPVSFRKRLTNALEELGVAANPHRRITTDSRQPQL